MKTKGNNKGFTLVEVVCAVAILMLVVLPIFTGFLTAAKTNARIGDKLDVELVLQNELEQIKATGVLKANQGGHPVEVTFAKGELNGTYQNNKIEISLPKGDYTKTVSDIDIKLSVAQVAVDIQDDNTIAYYIITITYDNQTADDESDDIVLEGVYSPW